MITSSFYHYISPKVTIYVYLLLRRIKNAIYHCYDKLGNS